MTNAPIALEILIRDGITRCTALLAAYEAPLEIDEDRSILIEV